MLEVDVSRRSFLRGALAIAATAVASPMLNKIPYPVIVGDGIHDDWAGLQAMIDGNPFEIAGNGLFKAQSGLIRGGRFLMSQGLRLSGKQGWLIQDCTFIMAQEPPGDQSCLTIIDTMT